MPLLLGGLRWLFTDKESGWLDFKGSLKARVECCELLLKSSVLIVVHMDLLTEDN